MAAIFLFTRRHHSVQGHEGARVPEESEKQLDQEIELEAEEQAAARQDGEVALGLADGPAPVQPPPQLPPLLLSGAARFAAL